jgi:hypothetical protein
MCRRNSPSTMTRMSTRQHPRHPQTTIAFFIQAALSFAVSSVALGLGIAYLTADPWMRAFLALGTLYVITSTFTLAK